MAAPRSWPAGPPSCEVIDCGVPLGEDRPAAAPPRPATVGTGHAVRLRGLVRGELNGLEGFAQHAQPSGRWGVRLLRGGLPIAVHSDNLLPLRLAPVPTAAAAAAAADAPYANCAAAASPLPSASAAPTAGPPGQAPPAPARWHLEPPLPPLVDPALPPVAPPANQVLASVDAVVVPPSVSVLIPTHKRPALLCHALDLIAAQDYPRESIEVVIVEDGPCSLPQLQEKSRGFRELRYRVLYLHLGEERRPIGAKRNAGLHRCSGQVIAHWDDDDYFGASRLRLQVGPIASGAAALTLLSLTHWYSAEIAQFYHVTTDMGGHLSTMCYDRRLWSAGNRLLQYGETFHGEDMFFFRNLLELPGVRKIDLAQGAVHYVYVKHRASMSENGPPGDECEPPDFLPDASREFLLCLRDQPLNPGMLQTIAAQARQEKSFLDVYLTGDSEVYLPRRFLMNMTETVQRIPEDSSDRNSITAAIAATIAACAERLLPESLVMGAWACSTMGATKGSPVFSAVSASARVRLQESLGAFAAHDVALLAWIFGRKGLRDTALFALLMPAALALVGELAPMDLANLTTGLARLELGKDHQSVISAILARAGSMSSSFSVDEWQRLGWAFMRLGTPMALHVFSPRFTIVPVDLAERVHQQLEMLHKTDGFLPCLRVLHDSPTVIVVTGFATVEETKQLLELSMPMWERMPLQASVVELRGLGQANHPVVQALQYRAEALLGLPRGHAEPIRISRHRPKDPAEPTTGALTNEDVEAALRLPNPDPRHSSWSTLRGGQRAATILVYLREGGRRHFGELDLEAASSRGAALVWPVVRRNGYVEPKWGSCEGEESSGGCSAWITLRAEVLPKLGPPKMSLCGA